MPLTTTPGSNSDGVTSLQVVWFKRDLRLHDHAALTTAMHACEADGPVLPLYLHEPSLIQQNDFSAQHSIFIRETLDELEEELQSMGGGILELCGEAIESFQRLWESTRFSKLWAHQETGNLQSFRRDCEVRQWCRERGVVFVEIPQNGVSRGSLYAEKGFRFSDHLTKALSGPLQDLGENLAFATLPLLSIDPIDIPRGQGSDKPDRLKGGRRAATQYLNEFSQVERLLRYPASISSPNTAVKGCSRLSPYLAFGVVSDREVLNKLHTCITKAVADESDGSTPALQESGRFFAERLYWRSAYLQSMETHPPSEELNDLQVFNGLRESEQNLAWLEAWKNGVTGFPLVDAAMKMLEKTGWVNMRLRGMLTSFAVNELWLPWREVGLHLAREFLDYEPAIHWNQLQIHSGTSKLSGPLTYSPVKQAKDHDPLGVFVKRWLPALGNVPQEYIFEPWKMPQKVQAAVGVTLGLDYPVPIVAHQAANDAARQRVTALREGKPVPNLLFWKQRQQDRALASQHPLF